MTPPWQAPAPSPHRLPAPPAGWPVLLCRVVSLPDGDDACLSLLRASLAWLSLIDDPSPEYAAAAKRGLDPRPIPPWE